MQRGACTPVSGSPTPFPPGAYGQGHSRPAVPARSLAYACAGSRRRLSGRHGPVILTAQSVIRPRPGNPTRRMGSSQALALKADPDGGQGYQSWPSETARASGPRVTPPPGSQQVRVGHTWVTHPATGMGHGARTVAWPARLRRGPSSGQSNPERDNQGGSLGKAARVFHDSPGLIQPRWRPPPTGMPDRACARGV